MQMQFSDEHFFFGSFVMLSRTLADYAFFMHPSGKWKLLLTTSSICYTNCKQSTTVINYTCVCALLPSSKRPRASVTTYFLCPKTMIIIVYLYLIACTKRFLFFLFYSPLSYVVLPPAISPDAV